MYKDILNMIRDVLSTNASITVPIIIGKLPKETPDVICIRYVEGDNIVNHFTTSPNALHIYRPRIRINVRARTYDLAFKEADIIKTVFTSYTFDESTGVFLDGDIHDLGVDEEDRKEFELNFKSIIVK